MHLYIVYTHTQRQYANEISIRQWNLFTLEIESTIIRLLCCCLCCCATVTAPASCSSVAVSRERTTLATTFFFNHLINSKINYVQSNCSVMCNGCVR